MNLLLIIVNGDFETNKLRNQEILLKQKRIPKWWFKKVHSPNALISRLNGIVINAFLSLYIELQVINQRKICKTTGEVAIEKF